MPGTIKHRSLKENLHPTSQRSTTDKFQITQDAQRLHVFQ